LASLLGLAVFATLLTVPAGAQEAEAVQLQNQSTRQYEVTITNVSGQPVTPPVVAVHNRAADLYELGEAASTEVQEIAENGNITPLVELAGVARGVGGAAVAGDGPLMPGESVSVNVEADKGRRLSLVSMVVCTNDGFTGLDTVKLPRRAGQSSSFDTVAYDAGTEVNVEDPDYWVPPCGGNGENLHDDENGVITAHPGLTGFDTLDFATDDTILEVTVTRLPKRTRTYEVTVTNNSGQPATPPVVALHNRQTSLYEVGQEAGAGVQNIAENGDNSTLVGAIDGVTPVGGFGVAGDGPILPGESATTTITTDSRGRVLSLVSMIVCTNDGFSGINSLRLPRATGRTITVDAQIYDAGTEVNVEDPDYWVPPCGGNGENLHDDENGVITAHPGLAGFAALDFAAGDSLLSVEITRVG
jgi:hypothetical protein